MLNRGDERVQLLLETASDLLLQDDPIAFLDNVFARLARLLELEVYFHYRLNPDEQGLTLASFGGVSAESVGAMHYLRKGQAVCGTVAAHKQPVVAEHVQESDDPLTGIIRSHGITAYACNPLIRQGRLFGTLSFGTRKRPTFEPGELDLMRAVCDQVAAVIDRHLAQEELRDREAKLAVANSVKDEFLGLVSHELRSPLTTIVGMSRSLERQVAATDGELRETVSLLVSESDRLHTLIENMLVLARLDQSDDILEPVHVGHVVREAVARHRRRFPNCPIELAIEPDLPPVEGLDSWLDQVLTNLLSNAEKYSPPGSTVQVDLELSGEWVRVRVSDSGIGVSREEAERLFEPFYRSPRAEANAKGVGLGLAVCHRLVELMGGDISASPGPDGGAVVTFRLPALLDK